MLIINDRKRIGNLGTYLVVNALLCSEADIRAFLKYHYIIRAAKLEVRNFLTLVEHTTYFGCNNY